jgi:hypothetical protein
MNEQRVKSDTQSIRVKLLGVVLLSLLAMTLLGAGSLYATASSGGTFSNVQVFIQTSSTTVQFQYDVSVYNSTGFLVASTQTGYPAAGFELPVGDYLVTATAYNQPQAYPCQDVCESPLASTPPSNQQSAAIQEPMIASPTVEYGYLFEDVSGPTTLTIQTQNASELPSTNVVVRAAFENGTAAAGAYISAFVVGQSYYWYNSNYNFYTQTDGNGMAKLTVPQAPVELSASLSVPVTLPSNETTVTTTVGGQKINVTVYWSPSEVELSGSALIVPPANSANITLQYLQTDCCVVPYQGGVPPTDGQSVQTTATSSVPQTAEQAGTPVSRISPFSVPEAGSPASHSSTQVQTRPESLSASGAALSWGELAVAAIATIVTLAALVSLRGRRPA